MGRRIALVLLCLLSLVAAGRAEEWGGIRPGVTTLEQVRERYGAPAKETKAKVEGYDTVQWTYEGARAPAGLLRMVVDFGIVLPDGYKPTVVRIFRVEPKRLVFMREHVVAGWGVPDGVKQTDGQDTYFYQSGLIVVFEKDGDIATSLTFVVPQPGLVAPGAPPPGPRREPLPRR